MQTGPWRRWWAATLRILLIAGTGEHRSGIANRLSEGQDSAAYRLKIVVQADEGLERIKAGACELVQLGDEVCRCIAEPLVLSANATLHLGALMGIAGYAEGGGLTSMQELVRQSETAANRAKQQGRNCACLFSSELRELLSDRLALGGRLRQAIVRQEFLLHYPRQVDATDGAIVSVEALVRWNSPEFGLLHPRRFVPVAEDSGLIVPLGLHIVEMACRQARAWQNLGIRDLVVSINVSAAQIQRPAFIEEVQRVIGEVGVDPRMLEFEITESIVMDHAERAVGQLPRLKSLGISLALDDFGMGHSSPGDLRTCTPGWRKGSRTRPSAATCGVPIAISGRAVSSAGRCRETRCRRWSRGATCVRWRRPAISPSGCCCSMTRTTSCAHWCVCRAGTAIASSPPPAPPRPSICSPPIGCRLPCRISACRQ